MLSPSSSSPFSVAEEDPIIHAARTAAEAAKGNLPTNALRKATLSTAPLQSPPQHITDIPHESNHHLPLSLVPQSLPASSDLTDGDAVVISSPTSQSSPSLVHHSSPPSSFSVIPSSAGESGLGVPYLKPRSKYKVVFLGDESTGKTSIITRFMYDTFDAHYKVTIGIDFVSRTMQLRERTIRLQLWDTAGQERFRSLIPSYIREAAVAVFVYDIAAKPSFESIPRWVEDVHKDRGADVLLVLVGSKSDLDAEGRRAVSAGEGERFAREHGMVWGEVSAKEGVGIMAMMKAIVALLPSDTAEKERLEGFGSDKGPPSSVDVKLQPQPNGVAAQAAWCQC